MALTNDEFLAGALDRLRSHGITRDPNQMTHEPDGPWYYQQIELGFNYRLTELQAALGLSQFDRLDEYVSRRHQLAQKYDENLKNLPLRMPWRHEDSYSAFHLYVIRLELEKCKRRHCQVFEYLRAKGIGVNLHYIPVHLQPYYRKFGFASGDFPNAEKYYSEAISLPLFPTMSETSQKTVIEKIASAIS